MLRYEAQDWSVVSVDFLGIIPFIDATTIVLVIERQYAERHNRSDKPARDREKRDE